MLLPGLDGTGDLFRDFVRVLPPAVDVLTIRYPVDRCLPYSELIDVVRATCPPSVPIVLLAESFSTPLAIQYAGTNPANLKAIVLCAGFATSPMQGLQRLFYSLITPILFRIKLPEFAARLWLVGADAPPSLVNAIQTTVASVQPEVLVARVRAVFACDVRTELKQVTVPILYIQAKQDRLVNAASAEKIKQIKPQTEVVTVDGPHLLLQKEPGRAAEVISQFIQQLA